MIELDAKKSSVVPISQRSVEQGLINRVSEFDNIKPLPKRGTVNSTSWLNFFPYFVVIITITQSGTSRDLSIRILSTVNSPTFSRLLIYSLRSQLYGVLWARTTQSGIDRQIVQFLRVEYLFDEILHIKRFDMYQGWIQLWNISARWHLLSLYGFIHVMTFWTQFSSYRLSVFVRRASSNPTNVTSP
jgi:hypothetical protein